MSSLYADDVQRGIELLDRHPNVPRDWRDRIDPDTLHLAECQTCVLGRLFGEFSDGLHALGLDWSDADEYGFATNRSYSWLTRTWKRALGRV